MTLPYDGVTAPVEPLPGLVPVPEGPPLPSWYRATQEQGNYPFAPVTERQRFIREHASRIDAAVAAAAAEGQLASREGSILPAARVWQLAKELWDAKPEDC